MKLSEINVSPLFISFCTIFFLFCGIMAIINNQMYFWIALCIFGLIGFIIVDLFQIILIKELCVEQQEEAP